LSDSVTVSGGDNPGGTIAFTLDFPDGTLAVDEGSITFSGDGTYSAPKTVLATEVGTYTCHASYTGDSAHNGDVDDGTNESLTTVKASPSISTPIQVTGNGTVGSTSIGDQATISGGYNVSGGTIHFTLDTPSATGVDEGTVNVVAGTSTYSAPNTVAVTPGGTYNRHASHSREWLHNWAVGDGSK